MNITVVQGDNGELIGHSRAIMQAKESTPPTLNPRVRIIWLIRTNIVVGLLLGAITAATAGGTTAWK